MENSADIFNLLNDLPLKAAYYLGILEVKTEIPRLTLAKFLRRLYLNKSITNELLLWIEEKLYQGKIGEAHECIKKINHENSINDVIDRLKSSEVYHQRFSINPENTCFICGEFLNKYETYVLNECKHCFHKDCLVKEIEYLMLNEVSFIKCPSCPRAISLNELNYFISNSLVKQYRESGQTRNSNQIENVLCANIKCGNIFGSYSIFKF